MCVCRPLGWVAGWLGRPLPCSTVGGVRAREDKGQKKIIIELINN